MKTLTNYIMSNYGLAIMTLILSQAPAYANEGDIVRRDYAEDKNSLRSIVIGGIEHEIKINNDSKSLRDSAISQPETLYRNSGAGGLPEDNEAPIDAIIECCFAVKTESGQLLYIERNADDTDFIVTQYANESAFKKDYYYNAHPVAPVNGDSGLYAQGGVIEFDRNVVADYVSTDSACEMTVPVAKFSQLPSSCEAPTFVSGPKKTYDSTTDGVVTYTYNANHQGESTRCGGFSRTVGPYQFDLNFQFAVKQTTCAGGNGNLAAASLNEFISGKISRIGLGEDRRTAITIGQTGLNANTGHISYGEFLLPVFSEEEEWWAVIEDYLPATPNVTRVVKGQAEPASISGSFTLPLAGVQSSLAFFYNGSIADEVTMCIFTNRVAGRTAIGARLIRQPYALESQWGEGIFYFQNGKDYEDRCHAAQKGFYNEEKAYIVSTKGSVFAWQENADGSLLINAPKSLDVSFSEVFYRSPQIQLSSKPASLIPEVVYTRISAKGA